MQPQAAALFLLPLLALPAIPGVGKQRSVGIEVQILARFNGLPLVFDSATYTTASRQRVSVTRLDFLISEFTLKRVDGSWTKPTDGIAYISGRAERTRFRLNQVPSGRYERIRFHVGLPAALNHQDAAQFPANHPLNPEVNGLHWGWMGGYVFVALEGSWLQPEDQQSGFSYHVGSDRCLMTVELPLGLELSSDRRLILALNVDHIFNQPNQIRFDDASSSTHSRTNDSIADRLRQNVEGAFEVAGDHAQPLRRDDTDQTTQRVDVDPNAIPHPLSIASYFPRPALPKDNPLTLEGIDLGSRLFFETRLSINNSQSCASCHDPARGFSGHEAMSRGAEGKTGARNAMALLNLAWKSSFFWDGRASSLREQVLQPIQNPVEMHETLPRAIAKLQGSTSRNGAHANTNANFSDIDYPDLFQKAFGTAEITADRIARALEQFLLVQTADDSKFDRALRGETQLSTEEQRGLELFHTEYDPRHEQFGADCFHCHGGPLFRSQAFANNGLDSEPKDLGRYEVTHQPGDQGKFAVPTLRNVEITGPYMHDGRFQTLEEVIEHYTIGIKRSMTLDPNLAKHPEGGVPLSKSDKQALVAFLKTLTDVRLRPQTSFAAVIDQNTNNKAKGQTQ